MTIIITREADTTARDTAPELDPTPAHAPATGSLRISPFRDSGQLPGPAFEQVFVEQLGHHRATSLPAVEPRRSAFIAVSTALRSANPLAQVLTVARGLTAGELVAAHDRIEAIRVDSISAFAQLVIDPTAARLDDVADRLDQLFPALVSELRSVADDADELADRIAAASRRADRIHLDVADVEYQMSVDGHAGRALYALLDDGRDGGFYHDPVYRPRRVGDIVPGRLAALLDRSDTEVVG